MRATVFQGEGDVRVESVPDASLREPTDALVRVTRAAICGSDLWFYRGFFDWEPGWRLGHEFLGVVEAVGPEVRTVRPGDAVIAPFAFSDGRCEFCQAGLQTSCVHGGFWGGADNDGGQAEAARAPFADGTLVKLPESIASDRTLLRAALTLTDVLPTGHHAAASAGVRPGVTAAVVGDGAVGLCAVLAASRLGAERIVAIGHHSERLAIARRFGATDVVDSHDADAVEQVLELTKGGAPCVLEAVGAQSSMDLAVAIARPGGTVGYVGIPATVEKLDFTRLFQQNIRLAGGVAPARAYIPELLRDLEAGTIDPSPVLDLTVPLDGVPEGYRAMHERRSIKVMVEVSGP